MEVVEISNVAIVRGKIAITFVDGGNADAHKFMEKREKTKLRFSFGGKFFETKNAENLFNHFQLATHGNLAVYTLFTWDREDDETERMFMERKTTVSVYSKTLSIKDELGPCYEFAFNVNTLDGTIKKKLMIVCKHPRIFVEHVRIHPYLGVTVRIDEKYVCYYEIEKLVWEKHKEKYCFFFRKGAVNMIPFFQTGFGDDVDDFLSSYFDLNLTLGAANVRRCYQLVDFYIKGLAKKATYLDAYAKKIDAHMDTEHRVYRRDGEKMRLNYVFRLRDHLVTNFREIDREDLQTQNARIGDILKPLEEEDVVTKDPNGSFPSLEEIRPPEMLKVLDVTHQVIVRECYEDVRRGLMVVMEEPGYRKHIPYLDFAKVVKSKFTLGVDEWTKNTLVHVDGMTLFSVEDCDSRLISIFSQKKSPPSLSSNPTFAAELLFMMGGKGNVANRYRVISGVVLYVDQSNVMRIAKEVVHLFYEQKIQKLVVKLFTKVTRNYFDIGMANDEESTETKLAMTLVGEISDPFGVAIVECDGIKITNVGEFIVKQIDPFL